ncbi:MAG: hypothetical protein LBU79_03220 [Planctomycetota bacterium]|jgi:hypothetical protein|nr:hypothetical protein [Planctomycetota bacterium]
MLRNFLQRLSFREQAARKRRSRATQILEFLEKNAVLALDGDGLARLGMNRKQAFQSVYDLVVKESIQMRADPDGRVVVMSNSEYARQMDDRVSEIVREEIYSAEEGDTTGLELDLALAGTVIHDQFPLPEHRREPWQERVD